MAKPIKETPILRGRDAERFREEMKKAESNKVKKEDLERMKATFSKFQSLIKS